MERYCGGNPRRERERNASIKHRYRKLHYEMYKYIRAKKDELCEIKKRVINQEAVKNEQMIRECKSNKNKIHSLDCKKERRSQRRRLERSSK